MRDWTADLVLMLFLLFILLIVWPRERPAVKPSMQPRISTDLCSMHGCSVP